MGYWTITIKGMGAHHNRDYYEADANRMAAEFVHQLRARGHTVASADFEHGFSRENLDEAARTAEAVTA